MDIRNRRGLKRMAKDRLAQASFHPKLLMLIHCGVSIALTLGLALVDHVLEDQIGSTGGLSGIGMRSILETVQSALWFAQIVANPFWQIGYIFVALQLSRGEEVSAGSLLEGFRKFGPVLRLRISLALLYSGMFIVASYLASTIFSLTPYSQPMMDAVALGTEEALLAAMESCSIPLTLILVAVLAVIGIPYVYRLRMAEFALMDDPKAGARAAVRNSRLMMRHNRWNLFRLDLSFWWFYLLEVILSLVAYGDLLLPMVGITLPWSATVSYYVFLILCYLGQLLLYLWQGNEIQVTYAAAYEALKPSESEILP